MIFEVAILDVIPGQEKAFQQSFNKAQDIIASTPDYIGHHLMHCLEKSSRYILLVRWENLADHIKGFRSSLEYREWKKLLHHYYDPFPEVEHYEPVLP